jgi:hypothetical protein
LYLLSFFQVAAYGEHPIQTCCRWVRERPAPLNVWFRRRSNLGWFLLSLRRFLLLRRFAIEHDGGFVWTRAGIFSAIMLWCESLA